jgi:SAM-dependent methyltransferase
MDGNKMRSRDDWERWYIKSNPWQSEGSDEDSVRIDSLLGRIKHARFLRLLDLGCGEGRLTNALSALAQHTCGVDIAENALQRARARYPHIAFRQGDILDVIEQPEVARTPFDFISAAEVLYYFQTDEERHAALSGLARIGVPACLYYFSVIVTGTNKYRRYFTHEEFVRMLSAHFNVIDWFPSIAVLPRMLAALRRILPHPATRHALTRTWITTRKPEDCKHVAYFAVKRQPATS